MATREQIILALVADYINETGDVGVDRHAYADWLIKKGLRPPPAPTERDLMARAVRRALKNEMRTDEETGLPYHAWQCVPVGKDRRTGQMVFVFVDTDKATREEMEKAIVLRVNSMVDDGVRLTYDIEHWNRVNPSEMALDVQPNLDLRDQVEWRRNADIELPGDVELEAGIDGDGDEPGDAGTSGGDDDDADHHGGGARPA